MLSIQSFGPPVDSIALGDEAEIGSKWAKLPIIGHIVKSNKLHRFGTQGRIRLDMQSMADMQPPVGTQGIMVRVLVGPIAPTGGLCLIFDTRFRNTIHVLEGSDA